MAFRRFRVPRSSVCLRSLVALAFLLSSLLAGIAPASAQDSEIALKIGAPPKSSVSVTTTDGVFLGSCTVADSGGNWASFCSVDVPHPSTVLVYLDESTLPVGSVVQENPITFSTTMLHGRDSWGGAPRFQVSQSSTSTGTSDIAVVTTANGSPFYDACYVLVGFGNEGCDVNRDGQITFDDIPYGTYVLRQTRDLGSGLGVPDATIVVSGVPDPSVREQFHVSVGVSPDGGPVDISLITRDPASGELLTDVCYVLVDNSNEGCDENADGQVTFAAIPPGEYVVRQTKTPAGYPPVGDYSITVANVDDVPLGFVVKQAPEQNAPGTRNVSIVLVDIATHERVVSDFCVQFAGASNVGCDEDLRDGQIDFLDVPAGSWEYDFITVPEGWRVDPNGADFGPFPPLVVDASPESPSNLIRFIPVGRTGSHSGGTDASAQNASVGTSNVAIVTTLHGQPYYSACFVIVDFSNEGCDANGDGEITFADVPVGTYTLRQTVDLGNGYYVDDIVITVSGNADADGWERFWVAVNDPN